MHCSFCLGLWWCVIYLEGYWEWRVCECSVTKVNLYLRVQCKCLHWEKSPVTTEFCCRIHTVIPRASLCSPRTAVDQKALEKKLLICKQIVKSTLFLSHPYRPYYSDFWKIALTFVLDFLSDSVQSQLCFSDLGGLGKRTWEPAKTWSALKIHL